MRPPDKTCIWIEYRQHRLSALLDTGSDVSIAGERLARELGWTIRAHDTEAVGVDKSKTMTILGAARVELIVAGHSVESEILIAPDFDGLLLGINWLRSQGRFRWNFDKGRIKFGKQDWIKLREETEQLPRANISQKNSPMPEYEISIDGTDFHVAPTGSTRKLCRSRLNQKFFRELTLFCRAMNMVEIGREQGVSSNPEFDQRISNVRERVRDDVLATLSRHSPCAADAWARYLIVRNAKRTLLTLLCSHLSSSGVASTEEGTDAEEDTGKLGRLPELQSNEGKTPEMSSVTRLVSPQRGDILEGELGPYIPSSPVEDLSMQEVADGPQHENTSDKETEEAVWTAGEVHFGNVESADGPTHPFPVLGVVEESTDGLTTPPPITIQLECNRSDLSPDLTDGKRTPAGAESMETAELKEFCPLVDCQLDTTEDYLHPATGSTSQDTGSSDIHVMRHLPDQSNRKS